MSPIKVSSSVIVGEKDQVLLKPKQAPKPQSQTGDGGESTQASKASSGIVSGASEDNRKLVGGESSSSIVKSSSLRLGKDGKVVISSNEDDGQLITVRQFFQKKLEEAESSNDQERADKIRKALERLGRTNKGEGKDNLQTSSGATVTLSTSSTSKIEVEQSSSEEKKVVITSQSSSSSDGSGQQHQSKRKSSTRDVDNSKDGSAEQ